MDSKDYYAVLGLQKGASDKDIRSAFRKLARQYHPDVNKGNTDAETRFKEVNEANEVLSDPDKRTLYDTLGSRFREYEQYRTAGGTATPEEFMRAATARAGNPFASAGTGPGGARFQTRTMSEEELEALFGNRSAGAAGAAGFGDFFQQAFSGGRPGAGTSGAGRRGGASIQMPGEDIEQPVDITLQEAVLGTTRTVDYSEGLNARRIEATIPAGVQEGARIRLAGQGAAGFNGGPRGDLYLLVHIAEHPNFEVKGRDIYTAIEVDLVTCMLGGEATVPTPKGKRLALTIPPETQNGRVFRLSGQGLPAMRAGKGKGGDLLATVRVVLPTHLSTEERDLFKRLAELRGQAQ